MKVLGDAQIISGFIYEEPIDELPALTHCGEALCSRGHHRPVHTHAGFEFLYLAAGTCQWMVKGTSFHQAMGDLFVVHPGEQHGTGARGNPENRHIWMGLCLNQFGPEGARLARELRQRDLHLLSGCHEAEPLLQAIVTQVMTRRPRRAQVTASLLRAFVSLVAQRLALTGREEQPENDTLALPYSFAVQKALAYMRKNVDRRIALRDIASVAMIRSVPQLCSLFCREVGVTPGRHHLHLRLCAARDALRQPSGNITHVALQYGFSSSQHFSTVFRRAFGVTPRQWQVFSPTAKTASAPSSARGRKTQRPGVYSRR